MKIIYVDDEKINLLRFEKEFSEINTDHKLLTFDNAEAALEHAKIDKPDLAFLDIEMKDKDGIWLAQQLGNLSIPFAFLTAHQEYAIKAFSISALHYVVKPVTGSAILEVISRVEELKSNLSLHDFNNQLKSLINKELPLEYPKKLFIKSRFKVSILNLSNVLYFEASGSYTFIKTNDGEKHNSSKLLQSYNELLANHPDFLRIHRAFLINKNHVVGIIRLDNKSKVKMSDDSELEISPTMKESIIDLLK